nr:TaqI-like C-terminal specificity domain-containing protein [Nostoc sp. CHAB 5836]
MLSFISSNKWFRAKYGDKLKKYIADTCQVYSITDFGDLPVFKSAAVLVMIFVAQNKKTDGILSTFTQVKSLKSPYPDVKQIILNSGHILPSDAFKGANWTLTNATSANRLRKMEKAGLPLNQYINGKIYYGVKTGFNKAFLIDGQKRAELIAKDSKSAEIIKPLAVGDDIRKWHLESTKRWLVFTHIGINIKLYPAIFSHLKQWQIELEKRYDKGNHWWELRSCDYYAAFDKPKIMYPVIAKESRFAFDTTGALTNDKGFIIPVSDLYLIGVLNSSVVWEYLQSQCSELLGKSLELRSIYMNKIPIPNALTTDRQAISKLVQKCLDAKGVECEAWEKEIDERVAALYGL